MASEIRYAQSGDVNIAYSVHGEGPRDLVIAPGFVSNQEILTELPEIAHGWRRLASFSRLICFDKREQGLSDRIGRPPTIEEMVDDMRAVMDAADSERAALFGISEGAAMALAFAATHPERITHLMVWGGYARVTEAPDYPQGLPPEVIDALCHILRRDWGGPAALGGFAPSRKGDPVTERWWARLLRTGTSPGSATALMEMYKDLDVRGALPLIGAPTLVLHRSGDRMVPVAMARYIADHVADARLVEFPGVDHLLWTEGADPIHDEIEEFVTGTRNAAPAERALATVVFTDIVDSTARAASLGDGRWRELLELHDTAAREEIERHRGRLVKTTGDGVLATFDGPARAIECARRLVGSGSRLGVEIRAGVHSGECELRTDDVGGMAVHIGSRVAARANGGEVLVSSTVKDLVVGSGIEFAERGVAELKGVPGEWRLYAVTGNGR